MENDENNKIEINGKRYYNLEDVPEPFRAMIQERIDAARAAGPDKPAEGASKMVMHKEFKFQVGHGSSGMTRTSDGRNPEQPDHNPELQELGGSGLTALLKFLIKLAPPPPANPRAPKPTGFAVPEERPGTPPVPQPGAIHPSSSGRAILVILIGLAAFYWFYSSIK